jgi:hypothetical protein
VPSPSALPSPPPARTPWAVPGIRHPVSPRPPRSLLRSTTSSASPTTPSRPTPRNTSRGSWRAGPKVAIPCFPRPEPHRGGHAEGHDRAPPWVRARPPGATPAPMTPPAVAAGVAGAGARRGAGDLRARRCRLEHTPGSGHRTAAPARCGRGWSPTPAWCPGSPGPHRCARRSPRGGGGPDAGGVLLGPPERLPRAPTQGLAGFMPGTWPSWAADDDGTGSVSPFNPADAVMAFGPLLLRPGGNRDPRRPEQRMPALSLALAAYDAGMLKLAALAWPRNHLGQVALRPRCRPGRAG